MRRVVLYCRVSTEEQGQQGTSLDTQRETLEKWAASQGWAVEGTFSDQVSGTTPPHARPGMLAALERLAVVAVDSPAIKAGVAAAPDAPALVALKRDRLARDPAVAIAVEQACGGMGALVLTTDTGDGDDPETQLMRRILDAFAEYERTKILLRTAAGRAARKREGAWPGGTPPWGLTHGAKGVLVALPGAPSVITDVFDMAGEGMSLSGIAAWLNASGTLTREGGTWTHVQVRRMIGAEQWYRRVGALEPGEGKVEP